MKACFFIFMTIFAFSASAEDESCGDYLLGSQKLQQSIENQGWVGLPENQLPLSFQNDDFIQEQLQLFSKAKHWYRLFPDESGLFKVFGTTFVFRNDKSWIGDMGVLHLSVDVQSRKMQIVVDFDEDEKANLAWSAEEIVKAMESTITKFSDFEPANLVIDQHDNLRSSWFSLNEQSVFMVTEALSNLGRTDRFVSYALKKFWLKEDVEIPNLTVGKIVFKSLTFRPQYVLEERARLISLHEHERRRFALESRFRRPVLRDFEGYK